jgi:hypothetical protein
VQDCGWRSELLPLQGEEDRTSGENHLHFGSTGKKKKGSWFRVVCSHVQQVPNTNNSESCQIIIPQNQIPGRKSDIYISVVSSAHNVVPKYGKRVDFLKVVLIVCFEGESEYLKKKRDWSSFNYCSKVRRDRGQRVGDWGCGQGAYSGAQAVGPHS